MKKVIRIDGILSHVLDKDGSTLNLKIWLEEKLGRETSVEEYIDLVNNMSDDELLT